MSASMSDPSGSSSATSWLADSISEMLSASHEVAELDPLGSLIDADMGAYYNWLNLQRLPGAEQSSFLVWLEDHSEAVAIAPSLPGGTESTTAAALDQLLSWAR